jgi:hypothetical protein
MEKDTEAFDFLDAFLFPGSRCERKKIAARRDAE